MKRLIDVDELVNYLRHDVHAMKTAQVIEKYAAAHRVDAAVIGDPLPDGMVMQYYKQDDGSLWARLRKYTDLIEEKMHAEKR